MKSGKSTAHKTAIAYNAIMGTEISRSVDSFLRDSYSSASNVYDKAMDAARIESGQMGGDHRAFDGGHTLSAAWDRVKEAVPDDTFKDELYGYIRAIKNDVITPEGLPIRTLNKDDFDRFVQETGVPEQWARDMASFTGTEVLGATIATVSVALNWDKKDSSKFAELVGGTATSALAGANPLLCVMSVCAGAIAYQTREDKSGLVKDTIIGAAPTAAFIATSGVIAGPAAVGLLAGTVTAVSISKILHKEDTQEAEEYIKARISKLNWEGAT